MTAITTLRRTTCPKVLAASDPRLSNRDRRLLQNALELAINSDCNQRHGALVYKAGKILARAHNSYRNTPAEYFGPTEISIHAEIAAITQVSPENLKGSTVYVARRRKCSAHSLSHPCPRCYEALVKAGVKKIVYTD